jgi:SAM-dependent methyltransferase
MITVDERLESERAHDEIIAARAEEIWHWRGPAGEHRWQRRADFILDTITQLVPTTILEIGSGTGLLTQSVVNRSRNRLMYVSSDISLALLRQAKDKVYCQEPFVQFLLNNAYHNALKDNSIDAIVAISVLHHLDLPQAFVEFRRILKPGGIAVFTEPNYLNPHIFLERILPPLRKRLGVSKYETAFIRWRLSTNLRKAGFRNISIVPFDFVYPYLRSRRLVSKLIVVEKVLEKTPLIREIAGSLFISFQK